MGRLVAFCYGVVAYVLFLLVFLYTIGFVGNLVVPKSIDSGPEGSLGVAVSINVLLLGLFAVQHSVMARPWFKAWWTKIVPEPIERSTYVLVSSLLLVLLFWQWRPMTQSIWQVDQPVWQTLLWVLFGGGFAMVLYSTFLIDHFDLFGLRQVYLYWQGREDSPPQLLVPSLYKWMRHPLMVGFLIAFWAIPSMTQGHLLFAIVITGYVFVGIVLEERDLVRELGDDYRRYREQTRMLLPIPKRKRN